MANLVQQKITLQQKKARLIIDEVNLKIKERKMRTRRLIEMGGLVAKANLDHLSANTLFGAIVSLKETLTQHPNVQDHWTTIGKDIFDKEQQNKAAVILKFASEPDENTKRHIRLHGLKWNSFRQEWCGHVKDIEALKNGLLNVQYKLELVS
ncbi:conjugal transfer TraD family protein [Orientia tsutsugamushi str. Gilliam]|uniref:Conjugal transfer TraD family protein n=1 Tax=Orientia tsutsugamushi str. Gilliam TaxID=1359184 RepID=A0A0F3MB77_ORITS|nr:conjugal transfer protein TraD [Orientia tsutsugamushi]KJV52722.1 conjugal transfer TraD family protein [Orientia tsutsugamushi str. Gilliam]SPR12654.1 conjugative transfer protein [Orientia tsutsugamushi str. Gilliam]